MSSGHRLNILSVQLEMLLKKIRDTLIQELPAGRAIPPHQCPAHPPIQQLHHWARQLELYERQLKQIDSELALRSDAIHRAPPGHRYRERQSIGDTRKALARAEALANEVGRCLLMLIDHALVPGGVEIIDKSFDLVDDTLQQLGKLEQAVARARWKTADATGGAELHAAVAQSKARIERPNVKAESGTDWLVTLTCLARLAHIVMLRIYSSTTHKKDTRRPS